MAAIIAKGIKAASFLPFTRWYGCARCASPLLPGVFFTEPVADETGAPTLLNAYCGKCITPEQLQEAKSNESLSPRAAAQQWEILAKVLGVNKESKNG